MNEDSGAALACHPPQERTGQQGAQGQATPSGPLRTAHRVCAVVPAARSCWSKSRRRGRWGHQQLLLSQFRNYGAARQVLGVPGSPRAWGRHAPCPRPAFCVGRLPVVHCGHVTRHSASWGISVGPLPLWSPATGTGPPCPVGPHPNCTARAQCLGVSSWPPAPGWGHGPTLRGMHIAPQRQGGVLSLGLLFQEWTFVLSDTQYTVK